MNFEPLAGKFLLLDTNVLIYFTKYPPQMAGLLQKLREAKISLVLDDLVKFEFLRKAANPDERKILTEFLCEFFETSEEELKGSQFPLINEAIRAATQIANIYSSRLKNIRIELPDCFLAGQMKKYNSVKDNLYLATANHKHFPQLLFNRCGIETVDIGEDILNIGFYMFDRGKFEIEAAAYEAATRA
jgi:predicted nucleic acid-binding protein